METRDRFCRPSRRKTAEPLPYGVVWGPSQLHVASLRTVQHYTPHENPYPPGGIPGTEPFWMTRRKCHVYGMETRFAVGDRVPKRLFHVFSKWPCVVTADPKRRPPTTYSVVSPCSRQIESLFKW